MMHSLGRVQATPASSKSRRDHVSWSRHHCPGIPRYLAALMNGFIDLTQFPHCNCSGSLGPDAVRKWHNLQSFLGQGARKLSSPHKVGGRGFQRAMGAWQMSGPWPRRYPSSGLVGSAGSGKPIFGFCPARLCRPKMGRNGRICFSQHDHIGKRVMFVGACSVSTKIGSGAMHPATCWKFGAEAWLTRP